MSDSSRVPRVSGAVLLDQLRVCEEIVGKEAMARAREALPAGRRVELDGLTPVSWVDTDLAEQYYSLIAQRAGKGIRELHGEVVRRGLQQTFRTLWRAILRFTSDSALMSRTPLIYSRAFDSGEMTSNFAGNCRAEVIVRGWPAMPPFQINGLAVAISTVLELAGRKEPRVTQEPRSDGAFYVATWKN